MNATIAAMRQSGATLVELVISIMVISAAVAGVLAVMNLTTARSADPMLRVQAHGIAHAYLEEILLRDYNDPDGSEAGETRPTFDDVDDYHLLAVNGCLAVSGACPVLGDCACDQFGNPMAALADYNVTVSVTSTSLNGAPAQRVDVTVSHDRSSALQITLSGYRTNY